MKIAAEVYYEKSMGTKVMTQQHFVCARDTFVPPLTHVHAHTHTHTHTHILTQYTLIRYHNGRNKW